jgi:hypothetical protein
MPPTAREGKQSYSNIMQCNSTKTDKFGNKNIEKKQVKPKQASHITAKILATAEQHRRMQT